MQGASARNHDVTESSMEVHPKCFPWGNEIPPDLFAIDIPNYENVVYENLKQHTLLGYFIIWVLPNFVITSLDLHTAWPKAFFILGKKYSAMKLLLMAHICVRAIDVCSSNKNFCIGIVSNMQEIQVKSNL